MRNMEVLGACIQIISDMTEKNIMDKVTSVRANVLMLGEDRNVRGGIAAVVNSYFKSDLVRIYNIIYISTSTGKNVIFQFLKALINVICSLSTRKIDIVHIHSASGVSFYRKSIFVIFSRLFNKKVIFHIHGGKFRIFYLEKSSKLKKLYIRTILNMATTVVVVSKKLGNDLRIILNNEKSIRVLYNPLISKEVGPISTARPERKFINVLFMGRLEKAKGVYDLIEAANVVIGQASNIKFVLCGGGETEEVGRRIANLGLDQYFDIRGWVNNKEEYYSNSDIFVLPSYYEGFPMVLLEAASYRMPIIATSVGGIPEFIEDGINGLLIPPGDIKTLAEKITVLINDKPLRDKMGSENLIKARSIFDVKVIVKELDQIYQELRIGS